MADEEAARGGDNAESITITVVRYKTNEVHFRVKFGTSMAKLKKLYADRIGVDVKTLKFIFAGRSIQDEDTPKTLKMCDGAVIQTAIAIFSCTRCPTVSPVQPNQLQELAMTDEEAAQGSDKAGYIRIKVVRHETNDVHFRVKFGASMAKLKKLYADRIGVDVKTLKFILNGRSITDDDTTKTMEMEQDDVIEVYVNLLGGSPGWL